MTRERTEGSLVRALGVWGLAANIVNITVGGGIFRLPTAAYEALGGSAPIAYAICAVAMGLIVLCFAEAGSRVSLTGGLYAYVEVAFGPLVGFLTGVMLWAGITAATAAVSSFFADALVALVPALAGGAARSAVLVVILVALAVLNIAGVRGANRFNVVMTVAKLLPLLLLVVVGLAAVHAPNLAVTQAPSGGQLARASAVLIFAFLGVESALVPSGEVHEPSRTVPRAIFIAMLAVTVLYLAVQIVTQGILGPSLAGQKTPLAEAAAVVMGVPGRTLILAGSVISMFGYVSGMTLAVPRMLFAFGRDGFLPAPLAAVHSRFHTPWIAIAIQTAIVIALAVSGSFEKLAIIANGSILLVYAACCAAVLELRRRGVRGSGAPFRVPMSAVVPVLAFAIIAWLLTSLSASEWKALLVVLGVAIIVYMGSMPSRRAAAVEAQS
ncbi:MAG TPA: APC family permease [Gemmatimonadaceae bacterium]|nr:APC family permease [Gemmatimonadaceae bacterium]